MCLFYRSRFGAEMRALSSHQCDPGSVCVIIGLSLLLVLALLRRFLSGVLRFSYLQKKTASKFQFNQERGPA